MKKTELIMNMVYIVAMLAFAYIVGHYLSRPKAYQDGFIAGLDTFYHKMYDDTKRDLDRCVLDKSACICPGGGFVGGEVR